MNDLLQAVSALSLTGFLLWVMLKGASLSESDEQPLMWLFNGLKWHVLLLVRLVSDRTSGCIISHKIVASEIAFYGKVLSQDELIHVRGCNKHQNVLKKADLNKVMPRVMIGKPRPPRPPVGPGGGSSRAIAPRFISGETPMDQRHRLNQMLDRVKSHDETLERMQHQLDRIEKLAQLDRSNSLNLERIRSNCKHENYTTTWNLDGSGLASCDGCGLSQRVVRPPQPDFPDRSRRYVSPWWQGAP